MTNHTDSEIAKELLGYHRMALDSENILRRQGASWACDLLWKLSCHDPARCWQVIQLAAMDKPNDDALLFLGVTIGGLLRGHPEIINTIARDAKENSSLSEVISWVEKDDAIEPSVWSQVELLSNI